MPVTGVRVVNAYGDGFTRGTHIGSELAEQIQVSVDFYHRYLDRRGVSSEELQDLLTPYLVAAETAYPDMMNVLKGMSVGAMVPILELFAINAFEELEPLLESPEGELLFLQKKEGYASAPPPPPSGAPASLSQPPEPLSSPTTSIGSPGTSATSRSSSIDRMTDAFRSRRPPSSAACPRWG